MTKRELYELAATRLSDEQDYDFTFLVSDQTDDTQLPLTWAAAHMLSPPRCYLASVATEADLQQMNALLKDNTNRAWTGTQKDNLSAFYDRLDEEKRMEKWFGFDGTMVSSTNYNVWNLGQPQKWTSDDSRDILSALAVVDGGLTTLSPRESLDGAFYECCDVFAFEK